MANTKCPICSAPIGYEIRFYREDNGDLTHADCAERVVEEARGEGVRV